MRKAAWGAPSNSIGESRKRLRAIEADINSSQKEWHDKDLREKALKRSVAAVEKDTDRDHFMSAEEAKAWGLVDKVIEFPDKAAGEGDAK